MRNIMIAVVLLTLVGMTTPLSVKAAPPQSHISADFHDSSWSLHVPPTMVTGPHSTPFHDSAWGLQRSGPVSIGYHDSSWALRSRLVEIAGPGSTEYHDSFRGLAQ